jgi:purine-nucleoside/S-methyl-5'-thioadenosine phosphorylase / adenosine deaminase
VIRFDLPGAGQGRFTTRSDGNLSTMRGRDHEHGRRERDRLCGELELRGLCASRQVHGTTVQRVDSVDGVRGGSAEIEADGHATGLRGLGMMVLVADCLPVVLGSDHGVTAIHVGWRGLAAGVLEEGVRVHRDLGGGEISAVIGPGAGVCCYEVGEEVHEALGGTRRVGARVDLKAIASDRLLRMGVAEVNDLGICTICDRRFFSHRREGDRAGRQAGVAWLS